jgi:hypothetical protein
LSRTYVAIVWAIAWATREAAVDAAVDAYAQLRHMHADTYRVICNLVGVPPAPSVADPAPPADWPAERTGVIVDEERGQYLVVMLGGGVRTVALDAFERVVAPCADDDAFDRHRPREYPYGARVSAYTIKNALQDGFMRAGAVRASVTYAYALLRPDAADAADPAVGPSASSPRQDEAIVHMAGAPRGVLVAEQDLYRTLRGHMQHADWDRPVCDVFCQEYKPRDADATRAVLVEFADKHEFELDDRTSTVGRVRTVRDVVKLYSVLVRLATKCPRTLFVVLPDAEVPASLSVVEALFALRTALLAGDTGIFLRTARKTKLTRKLTCARRYDLCAFQADNIVLAANQTCHELARSLADLVAECPLCLELLTDASRGQIVCPFRCRHAFHHTCIQEATRRHRECPVCREVHTAKGSAIHVYVPSPLAADSRPPVVGPSSSSADPKDKKVVAFANDEQGLSQFF